MRRRITLPNGVAGADPEPARDGPPPAWALVHQDRYWWNEDGRRQRIEEMHLSYLVNVLVHLDRWAGNYWSDACCDQGEGLLVAGQPCADDYADGKAWLRDTTLCRALLATAFSRVEGSVADEARCDKRPDRRGN